MVKHMRLTLAAAAMLTGPGRLQASLRDGFETMECRLDVQDRTALMQAGVGTCNVSDGSTTSVMW